MGLDVSHGAFGAAYSAFDRFRRAICESMGGKWPESIQPEGSVWYWGDGYNRQSHPGLYELLSHSDCDGEIAPNICAKLADELEALLPTLDTMGEGGGHIVRDGGFGGMARKFIAGCRHAARDGEPLEFY